MILASSAPPSLPFLDPVLIVATAMVVFLVVPLLFERFRIPGLIGLIVAGAVLGPNGAGVLMRDSTIVLLGTVGLLYLMLMIGLELDLPDFARHRRSSLVFGTLSFGIPAVLGTTMAFALGYRMTSALLVGSAFASHTLLAYPLASRLGIVRNRAVTAALGGTILTEILALLLLAVVAESRGGPDDPMFWLRLLGPLALYIAAVFLLLPRIGRWFLRRAGGDGTSEFVFVMASLFTVSYAAHLGGVEPIVGALLAGLALNPLIPEQSPLMARIHFAGSAFFIPFFLLSVGMLVNVSALEGAHGWGFAVALAGGVIAAKWLAAFATRKALRYTRDEGWVVFGLSVPHAAGTLAIVLVGFDRGLLDQGEVNGVVLMILATCLLGPWVVERFGRRLALESTPPPAAHGDPARRIIVPLANPATAGALVDLALLLRERGSAEPLRALTVVVGEAVGAEREVAEAERMMGEAVVHAAAADVQVLPMARVDSSVASGISRGVVESGSGTVVIGWDGVRASTRAIFGTVLDRVLERTRAAVLVARLRAPLGTTRRLLLLVPDGLHRHPGFVDALGLVNRVAHGAGASLVLLPVGADGAAVQRAHAAARPPLPASTEGVARWEEARDRVAAARRDDLVVLLSARRGSAAWKPRLEHLPERLAAAEPLNLIVVYPPEGEDYTPDDGLGDVV
ncbi:MAG TPA: cation:proton antiporter [Longimicrobium sp.]|nr:cation:proton antiporter [Longimicrobium sp.]